MKTRLERTLAGVVRENIKLRALCTTLRRQRNLLRRIAAGACLRIAGLEIIVAKLRGKGRSKRR